MVVVGAVLGSGCGSSSGSAPFPDWPIVTSYDGALLSPLSLVTIVSQTEAADSNFLFGFSNGLGGSNWWTRLAGEYGLTSATAVANLLGPPITADLTDHDVYDYISAAVTANGGPVRNGNTLYLLYLPAGINVIESGATNTGCTKFEAYHTPYGDLGDNLAVVQQCGGSQPLNDMTVAASHEIFEAATDPDLQGFVLPPIAPNAPWNESIWDAYDLTGHAELADLCEGTYYQEGSYFFQRIWSNLDAARRGAGSGDPCAPELNEPYYTALFDKDWYAIAPGQTLAIPIHAWSSLPVGAPWPVQASIASAASGFTATAAGDQTLSDRETSSVLVTAPSASPSGTFAVVTVASQRPQTSPPLIDGSHLNYVGVYVP
jgi:hypothetical protein